MRKNTQTVLGFASISGKKVEADFEGGTTTSDGGALLLRELESRIGIVDRIVEALWDRRHQSYVDHSYTDLIRQRVFQIACGYEDANDSNDLRSDPAMKAACERLPLTGDDLASQPHGPLPNRPGLLGSVPFVLRQTAEEDHPGHR